MSKPFEFTTRLGQPWELTLHCESKARWPQLPALVGGLRSGRWETVTSRPQGPDQRVANLLPSSPGSSGSLPRQGLPHASPEPLPPTSSVRPPPNGARAPPPHAPGAGLRVRAHGHTLPPSQRGPTDPSSSLVSRGGGTESV